MIVMRNALVSILFFLGAFSAHASQRYSPTLSFSMGIVNVAVAENPSTLTSTDPDIAVEEEEEPGASAVSAMSFSTIYEFAQSQKRSFHVQAIVPLMTADGSGVFQGSLGVNFYYSPLSSKFSVIEFGSQLVIKPKLRYMWGASTGIGYLVYNTESAKKSDVYFDLSLHGGGSYTFSDNWGGQALISVGRSTGSATTSIATKIFIGATYFL
jgi:hypothetical protein